MTNDSLLSGGSRPADVRNAESWLLRHGLGDGPPTPLLTARLAVRRRARILGSVLLGPADHRGRAGPGLRPAGHAAFGGFRPDRPTRCCS